MEAGVQTFKKCGISSALDGREGDLLYEETNTSDSESIADPEECMNEDVGAHDYHEYCQ